MYHMNNEIQKIDNPMGQINNASASTQIRASAGIAEVQAQVVMAKQFPRDVIQAMDKILNECTRPKLAEHSTYAYPRGGQSVTGPSIRLAESIARNWGNIDFGIREIEQKNGSSVVEAYCWDLENNIKQRKEFKVPHVRYSKKYGNTQLTDPRDIYEMVANQGARRLRACILGVIPSDVIDTALDQCALTMNASADTSKDGIKKLIDAFKAYNVDKAHIETFIGSRMDAIKPAQVVKLREIFTSLKDGMSKPWDWFDMVNPDMDKKDDKIDSDLL